MTPIKLVTAEMHVVQLSDWITEAIEEAARLPWWAVVRRGLLVWKAFMHARERDIWAARLYAEIRAEEVHAPEDQAT